MKRSDRNKVFDQMDKLNGRKPMKKKRKTPKQLIAKYEHPMRDLIIIRDGNKCQIAGKYHTCSGRLVADHRPIKRGSHRGFFNPQNLTTVCSMANFLAEIMPAVSAEICLRVMAREGHEVYQNLVTDKRPFKLTEDYVIGQIQSLKDALNIVLQPQGRKITDVS